MDILRRIDDVGGTLATTPLPPDVGETWAEDEPFGKRTKGETRAAEAARVSSRTRSGSRYWQAPSSRQTVPHGQPLPPGAQLAYCPQFLQLSFVQVQLWPPFDTCVAGV